MPALNDIVNADALYVDACTLIKLAKEEAHTATVRILIYGNIVPIYTSQVGFGEFVGALNRRDVQSEIGIGGALFSVRNLMLEMDNDLRIKRLEPPNDKVTFYQEADALSQRHPNIGFSDIWHLMAAKELQRQESGACLFTFDRGMVNSATAEGITAVNGNQIPDDPAAALAALKAVGKFPGES